MRIELSPSILIFVSFVFRPLLCLFGDGEREPFLKVDTDVTFHWSPLCFSFSIRSCLLDWKSWLCFLFFFKCSTLDLSSDDNSFASGVLSCFFSLLTSLVALAMLDSCHHRVWGWLWWRNGVWDPFEIFWKYSLYFLQ